MMRGKKKPVRKMRGGGVVKRKGMKRGGMMRSKGAKKPSMSLAQLRAEAKNKGIRLLKHNALSSKQYPAF